MSDSLPSPAVLPSGSRLGAWCLGAPLGAGGMGVVYAATRADAAFAQRVALKVASRGAPVLAARLERERRLLARLQHPAIATLVDGGTTDDGCPWVALEYVDGEPLDRYAAQLAPGDHRARVALIRAVAAAVQYAHEHLVVHRDLTPANILVTADGAVKLLDFGIARALDDDDTALTAAGEQPMTPAYASPEQRAGQPVTTATDIYALGAVLGTLLQVPPADRPAAPAPPADVPADLVAIVQLATQRDPAQRYRTAQALADDLRAWAEGRPVRARPVTLAGRLRRAAVRNPVAAAAVGIAACSLVVAFSMARAQVTRARVERDRAEQEGRRTEKVRTVFGLVLANAAMGKGGTVGTVAEAVDSVLPQLDAEYRVPSDERAAIQREVAALLTTLRLPERARPRALEAARWFGPRTEPAVARDRIESWRVLALVEAALGRRAAADSALQLAEAAQGVLEPADRDALAAARTVVGAVR